MAKISSVDMKYTLSLFVTNQIYFLLLEFSNSYLFPLNRIFLELITTSYWPKKQGDKLFIELLCSCNLER